MTDYKQIKDLAELKALADMSNPEVEKDNGAECFILVGGCMRSSKHIWYYPETNTFDVLHEIDDAEDEGITEADLWKLTNIGTALDTGNLYKY